MHTLYFPNRNREDEDEAYERQAQYEADLRTERLALAQKERAPLGSGLKAGLLRFLGYRYKDLQSRKQKG